MFNSCSKAGNLATSAHAQSYSGTKHVPAQAQSLPLGMARHQYADSLVNTNLYNIFKKTVFYVNNPVHRSKCCGLVFPVWSQMVGLHLSVSLKDLGYQVPMSLSVFPSF